MQKKITLILFSIFLFCHSTFLYSGITYAAGTWSDERYTPKLSAHEHYDDASANFFEEKYKEALDNYLTIVYHFFDSPFYADALYYSGVCHFKLRDYDLADKNFSLYLTLSGQARHFESVFEHKFLIAEAFRKGAMRHFFGIKRMPKIAPSKEASLKIYEEVIVAMPGHDLAAKSLYGKGKLLRRKREYYEGIEALKTLTRRFPKHPLASKAFVLMSKIYLDQAKLEPQNPDFVSLAQVNIDKMKKAFPGDEKVALLEANLFAMKEVYGKSLLDTGRFYEKKRKYPAASLYYNNAILRYPETDAAKNAGKRVAHLDRRGSPSSLNEKKD